MKALVFRWILYAVLLAGSFYGFSWLNQHQPGYLLIHYADTSIETTVWVALLIAFIVLTVVYIGYRFLQGSWALSRFAVDRIAYGSARKAQVRTHRGLLAFMEGNWRQAYRNLTKSVAKSPLPLVNYLAAARSAYELGERDQALELLHQAEQKSPDQKLAITLTQARMQLLGRQYESCIATLQKAKHIRPNHPVVLDLLYQVYRAVNDWAAIGDLLPELRKHNIQTPEQLQLIERDVHRSLITFVGEKAQRKPDQALEILHKQWQAVPSKLQKDSQLIHDYCHQLLMNRCQIDAEELLQQALKRDWHEALIVMYGLVAGRDLQRQLLLAESWLKARPNSPQLTLTLGRLCLRNELWGKAREYFEHSLQQQPCPEAYAELARLLAHLGEHEKSTEYYQQGLLLSAQDLPELPMPNLANAV